MPKSILNILVIDDCAEDREFIHAALLAVRNQSYWIQEASTAADGVRLAAERQPDCVLLDYHLPDAAGLMVLRQYTQQTSAVKVPIVMMTGSPDTSISTTALVHGAQDFLSKQDITSGILERVIQHAIIRFRLEEERREAMQTLADREALLRMAQEMAGIGTFDWQLDNGVTRFGGAYFALYGFPPDTPAFSFPEWLDRIHPEDRGRVQEQTERALEVGGDFSYDYRVVWPDGTVRWLLARGAVVRDERGTPIRLTGVNVDITAVKSAEAALVAANVELQQFAYTAGHDLQAPLRTISVFTDLLEQTLASSTDKNVQEAVTQVRLGSRRMRLLISDLLAYAQSGSPFAEARQAPLSQLLERAMENLVSDIQASHAKVTWSSLPDFAWFGEEFTQVFQNLIGNAIKYGRQGVPPEVHVTCKEVDSHWIVEIRDNGQGFDMTYRELIFQPFRRLEGQEQSGTGLGLPICRRIVEKSGGRIWSESKPGAGSTFTFTVPSSAAKMSPEASNGNNCASSCVA